MEGNEEKIKSDYNSGRIKRITKKIGKGLTALALIAVVNSAYIISQKEQGIVLNWGAEPTKVILNHPPAGESGLEEKLASEYESRGIAVSLMPGLHFKIPFMQSVKKFDRRLLRWNGAPEEISTRDKKYIWVDATARWYIEDPLLFLTSCGGLEEQAHAKLDVIIDNEVRNAISNRDLLETVRTDNREMQIAEAELRETTNIGEVNEGRQKIVEEITQKSRVGLKGYGIGLHPEGILLKNIVYVESVKKEVEKRMIAERNRIGERYSSEGAGEYASIMGDKDRIIDSIQSTAYRTAKEIEGRADAQAVKIYAEALGRNPKFYSFLRRLELYEKSLVGDSASARNTRLIIGTDNNLFGGLKGENK